MDNHTITLPTLTGSEKQIAWATSLRENALAPTQVRVSYLIESLLKCSARGIAISAALNAKRINLAEQQCHEIDRAAILSITDAKTWINAQKRVIRVRDMNGYKEAVLTTLEQMAGIEKTAHEQLPALTGSDQEIELAMALRHKATANIEYAVSASGSVACFCKLSARGRAVSQALYSKKIKLTDEESHALIRPSMLSITDAKSWIDARQNINSVRSLDAYKETLLSTLEAKAAS